MADDSLNKIEKLDQSLYSKVEAVRTTDRAKLTNYYTGDEMKKSWSPEVATGDQKSPMSFLAKLLIFAIIFFITTLGVAGFVIFRGANSISGRNIDLSLKGPVAVKAGDETNIQIVLANRNTVDLQAVKLVVEFPDNTKEKITDAEPTLRQTQDLGTIVSGEVINKSIKAVYFGGEKEEKKVMAKIEYKIPGSNSLYTKEADITFIINSPPISLSLKALPEIVAGQDVTLNLSLSANTNEALKDTLLKADYPTGFTFKSANPAPDFGNNVWVFDTLENKDIQNIQIVGSVEGQNEEVKTFKFTTGLVDPLSEDDISFTYNQITETLSLKKPFLNISASVNNDNSLSPVVNGDDTVRVMVAWANNLDSVVEDLLITAVIDGEALNKNEVNALNGFYSVAQNTITWTKNSLPVLASINPGEKGNLSFSFQTKSLLDETLKDVRDPAIKLNIAISGNRTSAGFSGEKIYSNVEKNIKVKSDVRLESKALHRAGEIDNSGVLPPKVGVETTYTIVWTVMNSSNVLKDTLIKTTLPLYIDWKNVIAPATEKMSFNPSNRELVWNIGKINAGARREVSFQLGLVPDISQIDQSPRLTDEISISTFDTFTETVIKDTNRALDTKLVNDEGYKLVEGVVIP